MNHNELRISKIFITGSAVAEVHHSEGMSRVPLTPEYHFINGEQGACSDEKCISSDGADYLEAELKRKTGCEEVNWVN
jgi:hypothetical protein